MVRNILDCIVCKNNDSADKQKALEQLLTILQKTELGIEAYSKEDTEWNYGEQLKEIQQSIKNTEIELNLFKTL